jgi:alpha/beta hydrolase fold
MRTALLVMAEADQRDLLPRIAVPTLLIWGEMDARSPLSVARQFENAVPDAKLVVIPGAGHVSNLFNDAVREFCRTTPPSGEISNAVPSCPTVAGRQLGRTVGAGPRRSGAHGLL